MSFPKGTYLGGIRDLQGILDRCRVNQETQCWHWSLYKDSIKAPRGWVLFPWNDKPESLMMRKAAVLMSIGKPIPKGWRVWGTCESPDCCNPNHAAYGPSVEWGKHMAAVGTHKNRPAKIAANRKIVKTLHRKLTDEQAAEIRASSETCLMLAKRFGVSHDVISQIRLGNRYKPETVMRGASVFTWADALEAA